MSILSRINSIIGFDTPKSAVKGARIPERDMQGMRAKVIGQAAAKRAAAPVIQNTNAQVEGVRRGLQGVKKVQKTFGLPGAK